jgi:hypothetical protein
MLSDKSKTRASASTVQALAGDRSQRVETAPSYENYLRIKQGVGAAALRAAGLPAAEELSYDAYAAALRAAKAGARGERPMPSPGSEPLPSQALSVPAKRAPRARGPIAWCVGLSVAFIGGMVINEIMRDQNLAGGPTLSPLATTAVEAASPAASPAPVLLLQPRIAQADHLPRPSPVASLPVAGLPVAGLPVPTSLVAEMLSTNAGPAVPEERSEPGLVVLRDTMAASAAQPEELLPKPKPISASANLPAVTIPAAKAKKPVAGSQSQPPALWDSLSDLLASNKTSEATAKQRWRNKSEDR